MVEFLRHVFGFCGELWHPSLLNIFAFSPIILYGIYYFKNKINDLDD
tara:strand:- start:2565 stop:2705 length:141 start_codon:yes stop_codon:yes gene_type:complete